MIKIIKTDKDYEKALESIEFLMDKDPKKYSSDANKLELLILLVKDYESRNFPIESPDPIDAIIFRMEQQSLVRRDLIPYIGSRSKVSEVLSRKRPLTLSMIRSLHTGLGIPIKVLVQEHTSPVDKGDVIDWNRFPIREMVKRGWIKGKASNKAQELILNFLKPLDSMETAYALYRMTDNIRTMRSVDKYALTVWNARVMMRALENSTPVTYKKGTVNKDFMMDVVRLSVLDKGPLLAVEFLRKHGVTLIIEPHLPRTHLDGAAIMTEKGPIIGLTLRYDRLDNFWFSLIHELSHVALHFGTETLVFYDDLDAASSDNPQEQDADNLASEVLIPKTEWERSVARRLRTPEAAQHLATILQIHPAIVAGRMRYYFNSYRILNNLIGHKQVRILFPDFQWR